MAKKPEPLKPAEAAPMKPAESEVTKLVDAPPDARQDAVARAEACTNEIGAILAKYRCRIMPRLAQEPVGVANDKVIIAATFWIAPLAP